MVAIVIESENRKDRRRATSANSLIQKDLEASSILDD